MYLYGNKSALGTLRLECYSVCSTSSGLRHSGSPQGPPHEVHKIYFHTFSNAGKGVAPLKTGVTATQTMPRHNNGSTEIFHAACNPVNSHEGQFVLG